MLNVGILTISDKGSRGERVDESGKVIKRFVEAAGCRAAEYAMVPDEQHLIAGQLERWCDDLCLDLILTTGGTGLSPRDVTPEATLSVIDRPVPGLAEIMRLKSFEKTPAAALSRAVAGIRRKTLIVNMPGSPIAVKECLEIVFPAVPHAVEVLQGKASECGELRKHH